MGRLAEHFRRVPSFNPMKRTGTLPPLEESSAAYYPGAGQDRSLCEMLDGNEGKIIYQDPVYKSNPFKHEDLLDRVTLIEEEVKGDEDIKADLVYIAGMGKILLSNPFVEKVIQNAKKGAYLAGRNKDLGLMGLLSENLEFMDDTLGMITGGYEESEFSYHLRRYPETMSSILKVPLMLGFPVEDLPSIGTRNLVELCRCYNGKDSHDKGKKESIEERTGYLQEAYRQEMARAGPEFYEFLGEHIPGFVKETAP